MLDRPLEQRAQSLNDLLPRHALGQPALQELDAVAAVDQRVADGDSAMALDPEQDVVRRLSPGERLDSEGQPIAGREQLRRHPHPRAVVVGRWREHRRAYAFREAPGVTLVPWVR